MGFGIDCVTFCGVQGIPSGKLTARPLKSPIFPGKYHQNGGFSMAMLVYRRVNYYLFAKSLILFVC